MKKINIAEPGRIFGAKTNRSRVYIYIFHGLNINNEVFSMCEIFLSLMLPFLKEFR